MVQSTVTVEESLKVRIKLKLNSLPSLYLVCPHLILQRRDNIVHYTSKLCLVLTVSPGQVTCEHWTRSQVKPAPAK